MPSIRVRLWSSRCDHAADTSSIRVTRVATSRTVLSTAVRNSCLLLVVIVGGGCRNAEDAAPGISVTWNLAPDPPRVGSTILTVDLADSLNRPIRNARVNVEGTMTHPGMRPVLAEAPEVAPGRYEAKLDLTMRGDWILLLNATMADGRSMQRQREVPGVRDGDAMRDHEQ